MEKSLPRTDSEIEEIYRRHAEMVYRVCRTYMKKTADTDDAVSETFVRLIRFAPAFESSEYEKAWLIRTASNVCRDFLKRRSRRDEPLEDHSEDLTADESLEADDVMEAVCSLPDRDKTVIYLFYFEGYSCPEIAKMLGRPQPTIRFRLQQARKILKKRLGDDFDEK